MKSNYCNNCGTKISARSKFCSKCGKPLNNDEEYNYNNEFISESPKWYQTKAFMWLMIIFMPYVGVFIVLLKRPYSKKVNSCIALYCLVITIASFCILNNINKNVPQDNIASANKAEQSNSNKSQQNSEEKNAPFLRIAIEDKIKGMYDEGLKFSLLDYTQVDPMECNLYSCKNSFTGKATKKKHTYSARIGYDKKKDSSTLYYLSIDGKTILWDENGEDKFIDKHTNK